MKEEIQNDCDFIEKDYGFILKLVASTDVTLEIIYGFGFTTAKRLFRGRLYLFHCLSEVYDLCTIK